MKIYNMLEKHFVGNADANMNCILLFKNNQEIYDHRGHYPRNLPRVTEKVIQGGNKASIEKYLNRLEAETIAGARFKRR